MHHPATSLHKIGRSANPLNRFNQLAKLFPGLVLVTYIPSADCVWLERFAHEAYSHRRVKLEWFRLSPGDVEDFKTISEADAVDDLPSWMVARRVLNEADGFEWGLRDKTKDDRHAEHLRELTAQISARLRAARSVSRSDRISPRPRGTAVSPPPCPPPTDRPSLDLCRGRIQRG